jgi:hypothetical protein
MAHARKPKPISSNKNLSNSMAHSPFVPRAI